VNERESTYFVFSKNEARQLHYVSTGTVLYE